MFKSFNNTFKSDDLTEKVSSTLILAIYWNVLLGLRVFKLSKHSRKIWDCYKSGKKFGWKWINLHRILFLLAGRIFNTRQEKISQRLYCGCSIWGVHSPIFVASVGKRADFRGSIGKLFARKKLKAKTFLQIISLFPKKGYDSVCSDFASYIMDGKMVWMGGKWGPVPTS